MTNAEKKSYLARAQAELEMALAAGEFSSFEASCRVAYAEACVREAKELLGK